jgi:MoxR-like ATPase
MFGNTLSTLSGRTRPFDAVLSAAGKIILGKETEIRQALACLLADGHLLIEDLPGMGKTTLAHALARLLGLQFSRVQFTSDLLPADITGVSIFDREKNEFRFLPGPVFAQLVLADEINRATPKTQSALLEAMEEGQVTTEGQTRDLPRPFFVIATQNPAHQIGTFPLPESQLDRFLMRIELGYPDRAAERALLAAGGQRVRAEQLSPLVQAADLPALQKEVAAIHAAGPLIDYVQALVEASRQRPPSSTAFRRAPGWPYLLLPVPGPGWPGARWFCRMTCKLYSLPSPATGYVRRKAAALPALKKSAP